MQNGTATLRNGLAFSYKNKHSLSHDSARPHLGNENLGSHINLYMNAYSSSIQNLSKLEIIKCPLTDKQTVLYTYSGKLLGNKIYQTIDSHKQPR